jgi:magnesium transporter
MRMLNANGTIKQKNTIFSKQNFIFLSQMIGRSALDYETFRKIGHITDIVVLLRDAYPKITALIVRQGLFGKKLYIPWVNTKKVIEDKIVLDAVQGVREFSDQLQENEILLRETLWDKQVVDISGSKLVRINDLHMLIEDSKLWLVHIDIGAKGLLRRLGWLGFLTPVLRFIFNYELKDRFISWKYIQPLQSESKSLMLKIPNSRLAELHPADIAEITMDLSPDERVTIIKSLDTMTGANVLQELPLKARVNTAELFTPQQLASILNEMAMDETVDLIAELPKKMVNSLMALLPKDKVVQIKDLLEHSSRVVGSVLNPEFLTAKQTSTAEEILNKVKSMPKKIESIYYIYLLDDYDSLSGVLTLRDLLKANPTRPVLEFMRKKLIKIRIDTNIKKAAAIFFKYDFNILPVVDKNNKLKGIVSMKDVIEFSFPKIKEEIEDFL